MQKGPQKAPCGPFCGPVGPWVITGEDGAHDTSSVSARGAVAVSFDQLSRRHLQPASETADGRERGSVLPFSKSGASAAHPSPTTTPELRCNSQSKPSTQRSCTSQVGAWRASRTRPGLRGSITRRYDELARELDEQYWLELARETRLISRRLLGQA
jgi:hypothetical protein